MGKEPLDMKVVFCNAGERPSGPERTASLHKACRVSPDLHVKLEGSPAPARPGVWFARPSQGTRNDKANRETTQVWRSETCTEMERKKRFSFVYWW